MDGVIGASLAGSIARGRADAWSDVDFNVFIDPAAGHGAWRARRTTLGQCGDLWLLADLTDMVSRSCMAFFPGLGAHVTYRTLDEDVERQDRIGDVLVIGDDAVE